MYYFNDYYYPKGTAAVKLTTILPILHTHTETKQAEYKRLKGREFVDTLSSLKDATPSGNLTLMKLV